MEAELGAEFAHDDREAMSPRLRGMLDYAARKSAVDYAAADRLLDATVLKARRVSPASTYSCCRLSRKARRHRASRNVRTTPISPASRASPAVPP
jgi:hypothetical protein